MYCKTNEVKEKGMHRAMEVLYAVKKVNISDEVQIQHWKMLVDK